MISIVANQQRNDNSIFALRQAIDPICNNPSHMHGPSSTPLALFPQEFVDTEGSHSPKVAKSCTQATLSNYASSMCLNSSS
eukprot:355604-Karenia_brevis.AAC.1